MIHDLLEFNSETSIQADVCIIGAGAAGIGLALSFIDSREHVVVLESGGIDYEEDTQLLADGDNIGHPYFEIAGSRLRMLGGSTNHWQGECAPLDPIDFEERPWIPYSGWPITAAELSAWYQQAHSLLDLGPFDYDPLRQKPFEATAPDFVPERLQHKVWRHSDPPMLFGEAFSGALRSASNIDVFLHANLVGLEAEAGVRHITAANIASLAGHLVRVEATVFVLAAGGLENPRILLNLEESQNCSVGTAGSLVGRFFMEHINLVGAEILATKEGLREAYKRFRRDDYLSHHRIVLPKEQQRQHRVLNSAASLSARESSRGRSAGYGSLHHIKKDVVRGRVPDRLGHHIYRIIRDLPGTWEGIRERSDSSIWVSIEGEQAPNPESRVKLTDDRDSLGMRKLALDWRLSEIDFRSIGVLLERLGSELGRLGLGRLRIEPVILKGSDGKGFSEDVAGGYHHMGTTRMGRSSCDGVVDENARVFGTDNLYIAGSSIFPTSGCANPTLTIVSLALRLADHLKRNVL